MRTKISVKVHYFLFILCSFFSSVLVHIIDVIDYGVPKMLSHHQIIHCKANFRIPLPPPFERKIWHFNRANSAAIKRCMTSYPWRQHLNINTDPNWQVKTFTDILLNIMSNFIPNEIKRFVPRDPPWVTKALKTMLNRKIRPFGKLQKTWL